MRAAILEQDTSVRITDIDVADPDSLAPVAAAALNPVDLAIAAGKLRFRPLPTGATLGFEGVAGRDPGQYVYFSAPTPPFGSFAERVDLSGAEVVPIPEGVSPTAAAAVGVPGIAAHLALGKEDPAGKRVLILGGTGSVGRLAVQIARAMGAERVVATSRDDKGGEALTGLGAEAVSSESADAFAADLRRLDLDEVDVVVDTIWGDFAAVAIQHMRPGGRFVQVGNSASPTATLTAPDFRNRALTMVGHSNFLASPDERIGAYAKVVDLLRQGTLTVDPRVVALDDLPHEWDALAGGSSDGKVVVTP
jgi:NADPH:quinone reductase-like Zn-dependent oxidoreductase